MTFSDWTFESGLAASAENGGGPTGQTDPWLKLDPSATGIHKVYPTGGTVNGVSTKGLNSGQIETFYDSTGTTMGNGVAYRVTAGIGSAGFSALSGFLFRIFGDGAYLLGKITAGAQVTISSGTDASYGDGTNNWHKMRVTWWKAGGVVYHKVEIQNLDGAAENPNNWRTIINPITDNTNDFESGTNECLIYSHNTSAAQDARFEATKFYTVA